MRLAALGTLLVCLTVGAQASVIVFNDGFNGYTATAAYQTLASGAHLGPWTVGGGGIDWIGGYWQPAEGNGSIDLSGANPGFINKTLPTTAGKTYFLSFWLAGNPDNGAGPRSVLVTVGDLFETFTFPGGQTSAAMGWVQETVSFVASGNDVLQFMSMSPGAYGPALDGVTVGYATPEPASMLMAGAGLLALGGLLRLRGRIRK